MRGRDIVDRDNMRIVQGRRRPRLNQETVLPFGIRGDVAMQDLERNLAMKMQVVREIHFAHAAGTKRRVYTVMPEDRADHRECRGALSYHLRDIDDFLGRCSE